MVLVGDNGMRSADGGSDDEREPRPGLALVTPEAAQLLDPSTSLGNDVVCKPSNCCCCYSFGLTRVAKGLLSELLDVELLM